MSTNIAEDDLWLVLTPVMVATIPQPDLGVTLPLHCPWCGLGIVEYGSAEDYFTYACSHNVGISIATPQMIADHHMHDHPEEDDYTDLWATWPNGLCQYVDPDTECVVSDLVAEKVPPFPWESAENRLLRVLVGSHAPVSAVEREIASLLRRKRQSAIEAVREDEDIQALLRRIPFQWKERHRPNRYALWSSVYGGPVRRSQFPW